MTCDELKALADKFPHYTLSEASAALRHVNSCPECESWMVAMSDKLDREHPALSAEMVRQGMNLAEELRTSEDPEL